MKHLPDLLLVVLVKRIFNVLILLCLTLNSIALANAEYGDINNGEIHQIDERLYTRVILGGHQYSGNANNLSIARSFAQRNMLLYPFKLIEWVSDYSKETQDILTIEYLRTVKLSARLKGLNLERQWKQDGYYNFVFSIPESYVLINHKYTSDQIISTLQQAVQESNDKLDYTAMLEVALRHPGHFNMTSIVRQFNTSFGKSLLKFMTGVPVNDTGEWKGDERFLSELTLDELFLMQSRYPYDQNVSYYLAMELKAHKYDMLLHRVVMNGINAKSESEISTRMASLAEELEISHTP